MIAGTGRVSRLSDVEVDRLIQLAGEYGSAKFRAGLSGAPEDSLAEADKAWVALVVAIRGLGGAS